MNDEWKEKELIGWKNNEWKKHEGMNDNWTENEPMNQLRLNGMNE